MKKRIPVSAVLAGLLLTYGFSSHAGQMRTELLGSPASPTQASRSITIEPTTRYVNVTGGETVQFIVNGKAFAWHFDGPATLVELNRIAPAGVLAQNVKAYVEPSSLTPGY